ncbi:MAG: cell wall hydrolase [Sphingomonas sp.]
MTGRLILIAAMSLLASCVPQATAHVDGAAEARGPIDWGAPPLAQVLAAPTRDEIVEATSVGASAQPFQFAGGEESLRGNSLECLTAAIYYEARSETPDGQRAVAQVVLNRARHPAWPNTVCGVVYQGSSRRTGCQFSFTCDGSMQRGIRNRAGWEMARQIAAAALAGYVHGAVGLATHYHTTAIRPWWAPSLTRAITIGAHIFYRWPGRWGDPTAFRQPVFESRAAGPVAIASASAVDPGPRPAVETVMGVTIHRGGGSARPMPAAVEAPPRLAAAAPRMPRTRIDGGVRVHRGTPAPATGSGGEGGGPIVAETAATR